MHRDIRWENVACTFDFEYFLLDLELSGKAGVWRAQPLRSWGPNALADQGNGEVAYTPASDMYEVGRLMSCGMGDGRLYHRVVVGASGRDLMGKLLSNNPTERPTAAQALRHPWIACTGLGCVVAGFGKIHTSAE